jgi:hypothetical protein
LGNSCDTCAQKPKSDNFTCNKTPFIVTKIYNKLCSLHSEEKISATDDRTDSQQVLHMSGATSNIIRIETAIIQTLVKCMCMSYVCVLFKHKLQTLQNCNHNYLLYLVHALYEVYAVIFPSAGKIWSLLTVQISPLSCFKTFHAPAICWNLSCLLV